MYNFENCLFFIKILKIYHVIPYSWLNKRLHPFNKHDISPAFYHLYIPFRPVLLFRYRINKRRETTTLNDDHGSV